MIKKPNTVESSGPTKVIVFDQKDEVQRKVERDKVRDLAVLLRDSGIDVLNCILAVHDRDAMLMYNVGNNRNIACVTIAFVNPPKNKEDAQKYYDFKLKEAHGFLVARKYKVIATKIVKGDDYPCGKIIVDLT